MVSARALGADPGSQCPRRSSRVQAPALAKGPHTALTTLPTPSQRCPCSTECERQPPPPPSPLASTGLPSQLVWGKGGEGRGAHTWPRLPAGKTRGSQVQADQRGPDGEQLLGADGQRKPRPPSGGLTVDTFSADGMSRGLDASWGPERRSPSSRWLWPSSWAGSLALAQPSQHPPLPPNPSPFLKGPLLCLNQPPCPASRSGASHTFRNPCRTPFRGAGVHPPCRRLGWACAQSCPRGPVGSELTGLVVVQALPTSLALHTVPT